MAYRNGIIADTLRQAGWPHKVIFGLNLPQLTAIARTFTVPDNELGKQLWSDREVRESRLLAPFTFDPMMPIEETTTICNDLRTREEADLLAFRWLRHHAEASRIADHFAAEQNELFKYLAVAIRRFIEDEKE